MLSLIVLLSSICCDLAGTAKTFHDYAADVFMPYNTSYLEHVTRLDIIWDKYVPESLKADARSKRGKGVRRHVESSSAVPGNWQAFLRMTKTRLNCSRS